MEILHSVTSPLGKIALSNSLKLTIVEKGGTESRISRSILFHKRRQMFRFIANDFYFV